MFRIPSSRRDTAACGARFVYKRPHGNSRTSRTPERTARKGTRENLGPNCPSSPAGACRPIVSASQNREVLSRPSVGHGRRQTYSRWEVSYHEQEEYGKWTHNGRPRWDIQSVVVTRLKVTEFSFAGYAMSSKLISVMGCSGRRL